MSMSKQFPIKEMDFEFKASNHNVSYLEGTILTQLDASISDPVQRKALKDIFRTIIWDWVYSITPKGDGSSK